MANDFERFEVVLMFSALFYYPWNCVGRMKTHLESDFSQTKIKTKKITMLLNKNKIKLLLGTNLIIVKSLDCTELYNIFTPAKQVKRNGQSQILVQLYVI